MHSHPVELVDPRRRRRLLSGLVGAVVALALLVAFARLAPGAEASVQPSTMSLGGFTVRAPAPEDLREGEDYTIEFDLGDISEVDMEAVREYLEEVDEQPQLSDVINDDIDTYDTDQDLPKPEIPDFDADISLDGSVVTFTVDGDDVHATSTWWQNILAGVIGIAVGAVAVGTCTYLLGEAGPATVKGVCGFVSGFVGTLAINFLLMAFDGKLGDPAAWGNALAISLGVGMMTSGLGAWIEGATPAALAKMKEVLASMLDGLRGLVVRGASWAGMKSEAVATFVNELFQSLKNGVMRVIDDFRASGYCEPPDTDDEIGNLENDYLVPDDYTGPGSGEPVAAHGEYIDVDGDGKPDFVDNDGDGFVSAGDALVGDIITHHEGEPIYELIGVTSVHEID